LEQMVDIIGAIESSDAELRDHFDLLYNGVSTDWDSALKSLNWARDFRSVCEKYNFNIQFIEWVCTDDAKIAKSFAYLEELSRSIEDLNVEFMWYLNLFENKEEIKHIPMPALYDRIQRGLNSLALLEELIDFRN